MMSREGNGTGRSDGAIFDPLGGRGLEMSKGRRKSAAFQGSMVAGPPNSLRTTRLLAKIVFVVANGRSPLETCAGSRRHDCEVRKGSVVRAAQYTQTCLCGSGAGQRTTDGPRLEKMELSSRFSKSFGNLQAPSALACNVHPTLGAQTIPAFSRGGSAARILIGQTAMRVGLRKHIQNREEDSGRLCEPPVRVCGASCSVLERRFRLHVQAGRVTGRRGATDWLIG
jgi:hypothetical protein